MGQCKGRNVARKQSRVAKRKQNDALPTGTVALAVGSTDRRKLEGAELQHHLMLRRMTEQGGPKDRGRRRALHGKGGGKRARYSNA